MREKSKYVGDMSEGSYNRAKKTSKAVSTAGSVGAVLGGKNERNVGTAAAFGGGIADSAIGYGYRFTMYFRCK